MARTFEEFGSKHTRGACPRCGEEEKAGAVTIRLLEFQEGTSSRFDQRASRQISMCEECTIEVYDELLELLNSEGNGGSRAVTPRNNETVTKPARRRRAGTRR